MSLINRMLQDLDKRSSEGAATHAMQGQVRAVAPRVRDPVLRWLLSLIAVIFFGFFAWQWYVTKKSPGEAPLLPPDVLALSLKLSPVLENTRPSVATDHTLLGPPITIKDAPPTSQLEPSGTRLIVAKKLTEPAEMRKIVTPPNTGLGIAPIASDAEIPVTITKQVKELNAQQRAENAYRKAVLLQQQDRLDESVSELEIALQLDPRHRAARQVLVGILLDGKRQDEAMRKLQEGLNLEPNQSGMAMILARLKVERGDVPSAIDTLQHSLSWAADRPDYQAFLAALYQRQGRHKEAIESYSTALRKSPQSGIWWMGLGISLQAENQSAQAQEAFVRAKATNTLSETLQAFVDQRLSQLPH